MRVISGKYKGRNLSFPVSPELRPTAGRAKEALFCILNAEIAGASVLDLFAGTGALGIECLSRGAARAVFADIDTRYTRRNLDSIGETGATVLQASYEKALERLAASGERFGLIFLDPPYDSSFGEDAVKIIIERGLLKAGGKIILEHFYRKRLRDLSEYVRIYSVRTYGTQSLSFMETLK